MDELIYILVLVAWVVYSIYNARQKKKQKEMSEKPASKPRPQYETAEEPQPKRSVLEELFGELEFEEEPELVEEEVIPTPVSNTRQASNEFDFRKYNTIELPEQEIEDELIKDSQLQVVVTADDSSSVFNDPPPTYGSDFDLRKAVIYSTILERPYH